MGDLTQHFSLREFQSPRDPGRGGAAPTPRLLAMLERLRLICGDKPMTVVSGYRSPEYNKTVGGAGDSRHMHNDAADIPSGYATRAQAERAGATGIGYKGKWVIHVDVRPGAGATWSY